MIKTIVISFFWGCFPFLAFNQVRWDGGGGDDRWDNAVNWAMDIIPKSTDDVLLDNSLVNVDYTISLPPGMVTAEMVTLTIKPAPGKEITLLLPRENTMIPGLKITGIAESLHLSEGATLINASGASSGDPISLGGLLRIGNGAKYVHRTARGNAALINKLSTAAGTEKGIFTFDVPGTAGYTVSLTGNTFGSLVFSSNAAGGPKSYSGSGSSILQIRGDLEIEQGASLTSTLSANILLEGNLKIDGNLHMNPSTAGTTGRSIFFTGKNGFVSGTGNISMNDQFRNLEFFSGSAYQLNRNIHLSLDQHKLMIHTGASLYMNKQQITGEGQFILDNGGTMGIGDPDGISQTETTGNVQTKTRIFDPGGTYVYTGDLEQESGTGLPRDIFGLVLQKPRGRLVLKQTVAVHGRLSLQEGIVQSANSSILHLAGASLESPVNAYGNMDQGWEKSFIDGPMEWQSVGNDGMVLPIGKNSVFAPMEIRRTNTGSNVFRAEYFNLPYMFLGPVSNTYLNHISTLEYWSLSLKDSTAETEASISLSWRETSGVETRPEALAQLRIAQYENRGQGLEWHALGNNPQVLAQGPSGWIESNTSHNHFSIYTIASAGTANSLPFQQLDIDGNNGNGFHAIVGRALGTGDIDLLQLERQDRHGVFKAIGASIEMAEYGRLYRWIDSFPLPGQNPYRLALRTPGGQIHYSRILYLRFDPRHRNTVYPNPAADYLHLNLPGIRSKTDAIIVHTDGKVVKHLVIFSENHVENIMYLPPGRYFLMVKHPSGRQVIPFLKL